MSQTAPRHFGWWRNFHESQKRRRYVGQCTTIGERKFTLADVNQVNRANRVLCVWLPVLVDHHLGIAVIGSDKALRAGLPDDISNLTETGINRFGRRDRRRVDAGMANHIAIREIADNEVVFAAANCRDKPVGNQRSAHFRLEIIGGHFRRWNQDAVFAGKWLLAPAAEKKRDVRILFSLGNAQLRLAESLQVFAERVVKILSLESTR